MLLSGKMVEQRCYLPYLEAPMLQALPSFPLELPSLPSELPSLRPELPSFLLDRDADHLRDRILNPLVTEGLLVRAYPRLNDPRQAYMTNPEFKQDNE